MSEQWTELLLKDHETTERVLDAIINAWDPVTGPPSGLLKDALEYLSGYADNCHNRKEETCLFPLIEERGIPRHGGPLAVMLAEHDQSRELLSRLTVLGSEFLAGACSSPGELRKVFDSYSALLKDHYWKENDILYPMARQVLSAQDEIGILRGIEALENSIGPDTRAVYYALADRIAAAGNLQDLSAGLDPLVLAAILNTLPIELSFIDAEDAVRYFSHENGAKIFSRTRGVIGTKVQNCHPQKSIHMVNAILADFKAGRRKVAEFWIDMEGRKIHIRYFPVRDAEGHYLGCLETVQNITDIQSLQGQKRLLD